MCLDRELEWLSGIRKTNRTRLTINILQSPGWPVYYLQETMRPGMGLLKMWLRCTMFRTDREFKVKLNLKEDFYWHELSEYIKIFMDRECTKEVSLELDYDPGTNCVTLFPKHESIGLNSTQGKVSKPHILRQESTRISAPGEV